MHRRTGCRAIGFLDEMYEPLQALPSFRIPGLRWPATLRVSSLAASVLPGSGTGWRAAWPLMTGCVADRGLKFPLLSAPVPVQLPSHSWLGGPVLGPAPRA